MKDPKMSRQDLGRPSTAGDGDLCPMLKYIPTNGKIQTMPYSQYPIFSLKSDKKDKCTGIPLIFRNLFFDSIEKIVIPMKAALGCFSLGPGGKNYNVY
jgi:hypothetical protein